MGIPDLTVVTMTYNRPRFVQRLIGYYERKSQRAVVLDGSNSASISSREQSNLRFVEYLHIPVPYHERLCAAGSLVVTDFVVLCGDDDFMLVEGLESCCQVLREHVEVSSACGIPIFQRRLESGDWHVYPWTSGDPPLDWLRASVNDSTPLLRLRRHFMPYCPTAMYGVMRRDMFTEITSAVSQLTIPNIYREEYLFESVAALVGSIQVVPVAMWIRSNENVSITEREADLDFFDFLASQKSDRAFEEFVGLVHHAARVLNSDVPTDVRELEIAFRALIRSRRTKNDTSVDRSTLRTAIRSAVVRNHKLRTIARAGRDVLQGTFSPSPWVRAGRRLERSGIRCDFAGLREIEALVRDFYFTS